MTIVEKEIYYNFKNRSLIESALTHSSIKTRGSEFERLEFLGDRVLGLIIAEFIFKNFKNESEGMLAKRIATLVSSNTCTIMARKIKVNECIKTSNKSDLKNNDTVLADAMESIIAAVFLDGGFEKAKEIVLQLWGIRLFELEEDSPDPKTKLQEVTQAKDGSMPVYKVISKTGSEHEPTFTVELEALGKIIIANGKSKKTAEVAAAQKFLDDF